MASMQISDGVVHKMPNELKKVLTSSSKALKAWEDITPLARNEFICWVISAKQDTTRQRRIQRTRDELIEGKRRPCCWMGCIHRPDKPVSPSVKSVLSKQKSPTKL